MNTTDLVHFSRVDAPEKQAPQRPVLVPSRYELAALVRPSILCAREYLRSEQRVDGSWAGATTGEITTLSQLVLLFAFLEREQEELPAQSVRAILREQRSDGSWSNAPGGEFDRDASVLAYFALKLAGEDACGSALARARHAIRARGGADRCGESTRRWLALLGQIDYELCSPVMPEWLLASSLNQDATSHELLELAARSVVWAMRPRRDIELSRGVRELYVEPPRSWMPAERRTGPVAQRFNRLWTRCERAGLMPFRKRALERASFLLAEAAAESPLQELGFQELAWQWIALKALGFRDSSRALQTCERRLTAQIAVDEEADEARSQPTTKLATDTGLAVLALVASGLTPNEPVVVSGIRWIAEHRLLDRMAQAQVPEVAHLLRALTAVEPFTIATDSCLPPTLRVRDQFEGEEARIAISESLPASTLQQFVDRLVSGLSVEQRPDGGWSGDELPGRRRTSGINHALGRRTGGSAADLTGSVLECITAGRMCVRAVCERAITCLRSMQQGDGKWDSATHARYIHATSCAVRGLIAAGVNANDPLVARGVNWLLVHQCESGGWGEAGGRDDEFAAAEATAIQTAWSVLALVAAGMAGHQAVRRGVNFLVESQLEHGGWRDEALVERDSPTGPWYQNQLHSTSWSLLALAAWSVSIADNHAEPTAQLRLVCDDSVG